MSVGWITSCTVRCVKKFTPYRTCVAVVVEMWNLLEPKYSWPTPEVRRQLVYTCVLHAKRHFCSVWCCRLSIRVQSSKSRAVFMWNIVTPTKCATFSYPACAKYSRHAPSRHCRDPRSIAERLWHAFPWVPLIDSLLPLAPHNLPFTFVWFLCRPQTADSPLEIFCLVTSSKTSSSGIFTVQPPHFPHAPFSWLFEKPMCPL